MQLVDAVLNFFVSPAVAADATAAPMPAQQGGGFSLLIMLVVFVFFMYFAVWRPQSKRAKEHRDLLNSLSKGDEVVTAGGILGIITKITDTYVVLSLNNAVEMTVQRNSIVSALPKGTLKAI